MKQNQGSLRRAAVVAALAALSVVAARPASSQAPAPTPTPTLAPPDDPARKERLAWFHDAKYGLFIHWGLYAIPAGEWKGKRIPGIGEWIMNRAKIPVAQYELLARQWNPVKFHAAQWVQMAQDAGMKYIVITSKHHDGFALYDSRVSTWDVVDATPFKRDVLKELAAACQRKGMPLGFYYSQAQDWHEKGGAGNDWDFGPDQGPDGKELKDYDGYLRAKAEPQVRELLTGYGPVALIWFDTPRMMTKERGQRFTDIVRSLQPKTLIDGRLGVAGDYVSTGDNVIPGTAPADAWEVPATLNHTWGYRKDDHDWKSPGDVTFKLVDIVSKGGNYLLNVGPMANGVIPQDSQDTLRTVGRWLKLNGEAVYGTDPSPWGDEVGEPTAKGTKDLRGQPLFLSRNEWRVTTKPGRLYFTFFQEPRVPFELPPMKNAVKRAYQLADGAAVKTTTDGGRTSLHIVRPILDPMATVVVVEIEGDSVSR
jgi:alpha-L-fucosidase